MQAVNPYLPSYEYVPDGEPRVFGDRVYVYGSHDAFNGSDFCVNDYVCWSAPADDLGNWSYEGVIYRKNQDPKNPGGKRRLCAPDVVQGIDGRYYLYYEFADLIVTSVAVCDTPAGKFEFLGYVQRPDGSLYGMKKGDVNNFDPGVLVDDDGKVYLYTGFSPLPGFLKTIMGMRGRRIDGAYCIELEADMHTMKGEPLMVAPGPELAKGTDFDGHAFYEANSMRKINGKYYFIYSSVLSHELNYAISDHPTGGFHYGGTLVSIGDIGYQGNRIPKNTLGNTHGSLAKIGSAWYIFYHRQTNKQKCARQACAEQLTLHEDGTFDQAEMTSCGLNNGPLSGVGTYEARIACNLTCAQGVLVYDATRIKDKKNQYPYFTQSGSDRESDGDQYIANMKDGACAAFKYFALECPKNMKVILRGDAGGVIKIEAFSKKKQNTGQLLGEIKVLASKNWKLYETPLKKITGVYGLRIIYEGNGAVDFQSFELK